MPVKAASRVSVPLVFAVPVTVIILLVRSMVNPSTAPEAISSKSAPSIVTVPATVSAVAVTGARAEDTPSSAALIAAAIVSCVSPTLSVTEVSKILPLAENKSISRCAAVSYTHLTLPTMVQV